MFCRIVALWVLVGVVCWYCVDCVGIGRIFEGFFYLVVWFLVLVLDFVFLVLLFFLF